MAIKSELLVAQLGSLATVAGFQEGGFAREVVSVCEQAIDVLIELRETDYLGECAAHSQTIKLLEESKGTIAGLQADYESRMEDLREADARIAELEAFIIEAADPFNMSDPDREKWYALHEKLHPENYRSKKGR